MTTDILVMGGGAAGFFAAIHAAASGKQVLLLEKSARTLNKVLISGGGRCNVTHDCRSPAALSAHYPRGGAFLKPCFKIWGVQETITWFEEQGVSLKTEADGRMFPQSDQSEHIALALEEAARRNGVRIRTKTGVQKLEPSGHGFLVHTDAGEVIQAGSVIVAPGGLPKRTQYDFLDALQLHIVPPLPSIFTFHTGNAALHALSGLSLPEVSLRAEGQKQSFSGPMLVTHWGLSGPAVLRCSAWLARHLAQLDYRFPLYARLIPFSEAEFRALLEQWMREHPKKRLYNQTPPGMPARFWSYLLSELGIPEALCVAELGKKDKNRITETVLNHRFEVRGKSPFKEEFVTAGGVALEEINAARMESKNHPGLFFAGEVLDIDGITGGFNFQAAWTTGFIAGTSAADGRGSTSLVPEQSRGTP
ncbi:MAG: hypothetical protein RLZZ370_728 [Bacteroidota bacterium]